jgi:hypothetical protein
MAKFEPVLLRRVGKPNSQSLDTYRALVLTFQGDPPMPRLA